MFTCLAILCPPLAVLATGRPSRAAANLGLTALFYFPGLVHALNEVDRHATIRKYDALMKRMDLPAG